MLSDDLWLVVRRLEAAAQLDEALSPGDAELLASILRMAALDAAAMEGLPLALGGGEVRTAPDPAGLAAWRLGATHRPPRGAVIIPFLPGGRC